MDEKVIILGSFLVFFGIMGIVGVYFKIRDWQIDKDFKDFAEREEVLNKIRLRPDGIDKIDYSLNKCADALKDVGTTTEEASSAFSELAKALDSPIITPNEARKLIGMDSQSGISIYEPIDDEYTIDYTGKYRCPACGTMYIHEGGGFIPNCKNCGSQLVEQMIIKRGISRGF